MLAFAEPALGPRGIVHEGLLLLRAPQDLDLAPRAQPGVVPVRRFSLDAGERAGGDPCVEALMQELDRRKPPAHHRPAREMVLEHLEAGHSEQLYPSLGVEPKWPSWLLEPARSELSETSDGLFIAPQNPRGATLGRARRQAAALRSIAEAVPSGARMPIGWVARSSAISSAMSCDARDAAPGNDGSAVNPPAVRRPAPAAPIPIPSPSTPRCAAPTVTSPRGAAASDVHVARQAPICLPSAGRALPGGALEPAASLMLPSDAHLDVPPHRPRMAAARDSFLGSGSECQCPGAESIFIPGVDAAFGSHPRGASEDAALLGYSCSPRVAPLPSAGSLHPRHLSLNVRLSLEGPTLPVSGPTSPLARHSTRRIAAATPEETLTCKSRRTVQLDKGSARQITVALAETPGKVDSPRWRTWGGDVDKVPRMHKAEVSKELAPATSVLVWRKLIAACLPLGVRRHRRSPETEDDVHSTQPDDDRLCHVYGYAQQAGTVTKMHIDGVLHPHAPHGRATDGTPERVADRDAGGSRGGAASGRSAMRASCPGGQESAAGELARALHSAGIPRLPSMPKVDALMA